MAKDAKFSHLTQDLTLKNVKDLNKELGLGAFGRVFAVEYCGTFCAAKEIHWMLLHDEGGENFVLKMFLHECYQSSVLRHPNLVQFLGVYYRDTGGPTRGPALPIMVMEMMNDNLTKFFKNNKNVPVHVKWSILHDVALGLQYLHCHSPPVIHRDLSPNNVLLTSRMVAKIGDLGVAKVIKVDNRTVSRYTQAPGTTDFMPPEALQITPKYGTPLDVFSYAGIVLFVSNQEWPRPTELAYKDPNNAKGLLARTEVERRKHYIDKLSGAGFQAIEPTVVACLMNEPDERPSIMRVCKEVKEIKDAHAKSDPNATMDLIAMHNAIEKLKEKIGEQTAEIEELQKRLSSSEVEINQLNDVITELELKKNEVKIENKMLKRRIEQIKESSKKNEEHQYILEIGYEKLKTENEQLKQTLKLQNSVDVSSSNFSISTKVLKHGSYYVGYEAQYSGKQYIAKKQQAKNKFSKKLLKQERKLLVNLKHPYIVQQLGVFDSAGSPVLLMERMWMTLSEFISDKQSYHTKLSILHNTACGLQYIHERGIIHCDLTADNILLTEKIIAKLADFGRAGFCQDAIKYLPEVSDHLPPEVHKPYPKNSRSPKMDVFSFGCVIIYMFIQEQPTSDFDKYVETSEAGKYRHHSEIERRSVCLKKFNNNCNSVKLHSVVLKCLQDNPDDRPTAPILCSLVEKQLSPNLFKYVEDVCPEVTINSNKCCTSIATLLVEQLRLLSILNVNDYNITDQGAAMIAAMLMETASLIKLDLSNTMLNSLKATTVISALKNTSSLKVFNISHNDIDDGAADSITAVISNSFSMEIINLSSNKLSYAAVAKIASTLSEKSNLKAVDISNTFTASDNITELATALSKCTALQELNISYNLLGLTNVLAIAQAFRYHTSLENLNLSSNNVSSSSACKFIVDVILSVNQKLSNLNVCGKNLRPRYIASSNSKNNSTTLTLQALYSLQHASFSLDKQTNIIKVVETCPVSTNDIISYYVDHDGGEFYTQYHNFAIVVPPGAVAKGDCVEIQGTASYFGAYKIPDKFYPISSHFWISANYVFKSQVYLIMNHYAKIRSVKDIDNLHVLHKCAQDFTTMSDDLTMSTISDGVYFDNEIRYCVLATDHFCSYCQAKDVRHIPEYLTACYCTYDEPSSGSLLAEVCFCPSSFECIKVILEQCSKRNAKLQHSDTFFVVDGDELYISSIDKSNLNNQGWILNEYGKLFVTHLHDFEYWRIFRDLTVKEIKEREERFEYPPRLQMKCKQIDPSKPLYSSFKVFKRSKNKEIPIAQFLLEKASPVPFETAMQPDVQYSPAVLPVPSQHTILKLKPIMHHLNKIVVPKVSAEWEDIAYALRYDIPTVEKINVKCKENPTKCCKELFKNWLTTDNGAKPKIWQTLMEKLNDIEELSGVTGDIMKMLIQMDPQA